MRSVPPARSSALLLAGLAMVGLAACSASGGSPTAQSPVGVVMSPSVSPSVSPSPSETPIPRSVLSGRVGAKDGRVLVVKLDNTPYSNPHAGLEKADVVYIEQVEGGLTRYAAVFSTRVPKMIGPIRSARIADLELFRQYGKVAFAFSGANPKLLPVIARSDIVDVSADTGDNGYWRQSGRNAPYNFFGNGRTLLGRAPHAVKAHDVGFSFDDAVPAGGHKVQSVTARWPAAKAQFVWSKKQQRWLLTMNDTSARTVAGGQLGGTTVIFQYAKTYNSKYGDKYGGITPMIDTVGSGTAVIARNGRTYAAKWSRPTAASGTTWTVGGKEFPLAGGQVWVVLVNKTTPVQQTKG